MKATWDRIHFWLRANAPHVLARLRPGATEEQIQAAEAELGVTFPESVRQTYLIHDGQNGSGGFMEGYEWLSLKGIVYQWRGWKDIVEAGDFEGIQSTPDPGVSDECYNLGWIPLTHSGSGDHQCLDLAPAEGGTMGQVINFFHDDSTREALAPSFAAWLAAFADSLEAGRYNVTEYGLEPA